MSGAQLAYEILWSLRCCVKPLYDVAMMKRFEETHIMSCPKQSHVSMILVISSSIAVDHMRRFHNVSRCSLDCLTRRVNNMVHWAFSGPFMQVLSLLLRVCFCRDEMPNKGAKSFKCANK
jgi:hypothetical protein